MKTMSLVLASAFFFSTLAFAGPRPVRITSDQLAADLRDDLPAFSGASDCSFTSRMRGRNLVVQVNRTPVTIHPDLRILKVEGEFQTKYLLGSGPSQVLLVITHADDAYVSAEIRHGSKSIECRVDF